MAEVAAGLWAAEEVVSTGVQAGIAGYAVSQPTMPLKATFTQIASTADDVLRSSLARSHHTVTVIENKAYIFGGQSGPNKLASNEVHAIALTKKDAPASEYQVLPAIAADESRSVPSTRTKHAACAIGKRIAIFGGCDEPGKVIDENSKIWLYDTEKLAWESLEPASHPERTPPPRSLASLLPHNGNLVLYGGSGVDGEALTDVWYFDCFTKVWNQLPHASVAATNAAILGDMLYLIACSPDSLSSEIHHLNIKLFDEQPPTWESITVPTNPVVPGPKPRDNAGLIPITTGYGRNYLLYFFGDRQGTAEKGERLQWSDLWTFQLPSSDLEMKAAINMSEAIKPAKIKDQIRSKFGADTASTWGEVEVQAPEELQADQGKAHPGPRSSFGYGVTSDGKTVVMWGGENANGETEGDGWIIRFA